MDNGKNYLYIKAVDGAGNISEDTLSRILLVDTDSPEIPIITGITHPVATTPDHAVSETSAVFNLSIATSPPSGLAKYKYKLFTIYGNDSNTLVELEPETEKEVLGNELTIQSLSDNKIDEYYYLEVWAVSGSGKESSNSAVYKFRIDSLPPENLTIQSISHPMDDIYYGNDIASLNWQKPRDTTGVKKLLYKV